MVFFISCESDTVERQNLDAEVTYKRDMIVEVNGQTFEGVGVLPKASKYSFHVEARGDLDLFVMTTCHKEESKEAAWNVKKEIKTGLFGWGRKKIDVKREVKFDFYPTPLEADGACPMELGGFELEKGRHSWAFIDFESDDYTLPALIQCNGRAYNSNGTTVCQARTGLAQKISFKVEVETTSNPCGITGKGKQFEFDIPRGKCAVVFMEPVSKKFHKMTLIGYEKLLIRK